MSGRSVQGRQGGVRVARRRRGGTCTCPFAASERASRHAARACITRASGSAAAVRSPGMPRHPPGPAAPPAAARRAARARTRKTRRGAAAGFGGRMRVCARAACSGLRGQQAGTRRTSRVRLQQHVRAPRAGEQCSAVRVIKKREGRRAAQAAGVHKRGEREAPTAAAAALHAQQARLAERGARARAAARLCAVARGARTVRGSGRRGVGEQGDLAACLNVRCPSFRLLAASAARACPRGRRGSAAGGRAALPPGLSGQRSGPACRLRATRASAAR
jgi:hypothetical protein